MPHVVHNIDLVSPCINLNEYRWRPHPAKIAFIRSPEAGSYPVPDTPWGNGFQVTGWRGKVWCYKLLPTVDNSVWDAGPRPNAMSLYFQDSRSVSSVPETGGSRRPRRRRFSDAASVTSGTPQSAIPDDFGQWNTESADQRRSSFENMSPQNLRDKLTDDKWVHRVFVAIASVYFSIPP